MLDSGLIGVEASLVQINPPPHTPPASRHHLCNSGPFRPKMNDRTAPSPLLVRGDTRGEIKTTGVAFFRRQIDGGRVEGRSQTPF